MSTNALVSRAGTMLLAMLLGACVLRFAVARQTVAPTTVPTTQIAPQTDYAAEAREVSRYIQEQFYLSKSGLYAKSIKDRTPDFMWGNGVMFSALLGAARHEPKIYAPLVSRFFTSMNEYWDGKVKLGGYEPSRTKGNGRDKYYDDNAWMVITFAEAFEMTKDMRYSLRAKQTMDFVLSGWDDSAGGGIWWHEGHKDGSKNTCANAPAAVGCLAVAKFQTAAEAKVSIASATKIVTWTKTTFESPEGLYADHINVESGKINRGQLTYNTALMIRAFAGLYRATGDENYLAQAKRSALACDRFLDPKTHAYRDPVKWSHLLVEADLEMYRLTKDNAFLDRASQNADHQYAAWKTAPPDELIDNAAIARILWLMADTQSTAGQQFWNRHDQR